MTRSVPEWIGKTDDQVPDPRVRLRVLDRFHERCYLCTHKIRAGEYWECDHVVALCNGGENREANLAPACRSCCKPKTAADVVEKSKIATKRKGHVLPKPLSRWGASRGSRYKQKIGGGTVLR